MVRLLEKGQKGPVIGSFYIKPNYPGRCAHICNAGFITDKKWRGMGINSIMCVAYSNCAKILGYEGSVFNLVFTSNESSLRTWRRYGFSEIGTIPKVAKLKGIPGKVDCKIVYKDLDEYNVKDHPLEKEVDELKKRREKRRKSKL